MRISIDDRGELQALGRALRSVEDGSAIRRRMARDVREAAKPAVARVRAAYLAGPSRTGHGTLRRSLARATTISARSTGRSAGVVISVKGRRMPDGMGRLPKLYEGEAGAWRHPTYGRDPWQGQASRPTFYPAVRPYRRIVERKVLEIATDVAKVIAGKGARIG